MTYDEGDDLKYEVVWAANEDATGVHELVWSANGWWPEKPASERLRMAEDAVRWALDRGLIELYDDDSDDARALAPHERDERLRAWQTWAIPDGPVLYFWRTDAGEEWLERKPLPRSWANRAWFGDKGPKGDVDVPDLS